MLHGDQMLPLLPWGEAELAGDALVAPDASLETPVLTITPPGAESALYAPDAGQEPPCLA